MKLSLAGLTIVLGLQIRRRCCISLGILLFVSHPLYYIHSWIVGVGDSSAVEPALWDTQVLRGCGFKSHWVHTLSPRATAVLPPAWNWERPDAVYGSLALKAHYFLVCKRVRQPRDFNVKIYHSKFYPHCIRWVPASRYELYLLWGLITPGKNIQPLEIYFTFIATDIFI